MKHFYLSVFALLVCITANAIETKQDTLTTKDGRKIICENLKIGDDMVMYTLPGEFEAVTMFMDDIVSINGKKPSKLSATIITTDGDTITCTVEKETGTVLQYLENGELPLKTISKEKVAKLVKYDGSFRTFENERAAIEDARRMEIEKMQRIAQAKAAGDSKDFTDGYVAYENRGRGRVYLDGYHISDEKYARLCENIDYDLWRQYRKGTQMRTSGIVFMSFGVPLTATAISMFIAGAATMSTSAFHNSPLYTMSVAYISAGAPLMTIGIPLYCAGVKNCKRSVAGFNSQNAKYNKDIALNLGVTSSGGIGLVMNY